MQPRWQPIVSSYADPRIVANSSSRATKLSNFRLRLHPSRVPDDVPCPGSQKMSKLGGKRNDISGFTLPNDEDLPAHPFQGLGDAFIASHVSKELCPPKTFARFGNGSLTTPPMLMPKTAVHEYDLPTRRECEVGDAWKVATVQTKSIPERVHEPANQDLGLGISAANARHEAATLR